MNQQDFTTALGRAWATHSRWKGVTRPYTAADVYRLRGSLEIEYSLARYGARRLWQLFQDDDYVAVLSAITGNQAQLMLGRYLDAGAAGELDPAEARTWLERAAAQGIAEAGQDLATLSP